MYDTVDCPYCGKENDMSDALCDGLSDDNKLDWECKHCEKEFEVYVEFEPTYSASKIVYEKCDECGRKVRDIHKHGRTYPFPKVEGKNQLCLSCYSNLILKEI